MIKFQECYLMVNDTRCIVQTVDTARADWKSIFVVKTSPLPSINIAISTILAQGSAIKQCRPLVQNRSDFE